MKIHVSMQPMCLSPVTPRPQVIWAGGETHSVHVLALCPLPPFCSPSFYRERRPLSLCTHGDGLPDYNPSHCAVQSSPWCLPFPPSDLLILKALKSASPQPPLSPAVPATLLDRGVYEEAPSLLSHLNTMQFGLPSRSIPPTNTLY